jgi:hypothetical protein
MATPEPPTSPATVMVKETTTLPDGRILIRYWWREVAAR